MGEYERAHAYFFGYRGNWGSFHEVEDGYIGELLGIPEEEYSDGYIYCGDTPAETFRDFLDAVYVYELVQERDRNPIGVEPLSEEEVEDMYCKFLKRMGSAAAEVLEQSGYTMDDIDYVVCHQANERIIDAVVKRMDIPEEKVVKVIARYGNTSAASIPITLDEMYEQGMLEKGNRILLATFGAGFTWASMIVEI